MVFISLEKALQNIDPSSLIIQPDIAKKGFRRFTRAYHSSNEDLDLVFKHCQHAGQNIYGILGAADYAISALGAGANSFIGIDISVFPLLFAELKIAAIKSLDYLDYIQFYFHKPMKGAFNYDTMPTKIHKSLASEKLFSAETYSLLRKDLNPASAKFFDSIIGKSYTAPNGNEMPLAFHYLLQTKSFYDAKFIDFLSDEFRYEAARKAISPKGKLKMFVGDIFDTGSALVQGVDLIYFSNIIDHQTPRDASSAIRSFERKVNHDTRYALFSLYAATIRFDYRIHTPKWFKGDKREACHELAIVLHK